MFRVREKNFSRKLLCRQKLGLLEREREGEKGFLLLEKEEEVIAFSRGEKKKHCEKGKGRELCGRNSNSLSWSDPTNFTGTFKVVWRTWIHTRSKKVRIVDFKIGRRDAPLDLVALCFVARFSLR